MCADGLVSINSNGDYNFTQATSSANSNAAATAALAAPAAPELKADPESDEAAPQHEKLVSAGLRKSTIPKYKALEDVKPRFVLSIRFDDKNLRLVLQSGAEPKRQCG